MAEIIAIIYNENIIVAPKSGEDYLQFETEDFMHIDIQRNYFIKDAIREGRKRKFDPKKVIKVMVHRMCT